MQRVAAMVSVAQLFILMVCIVAARQVFFSVAQCNIAQRANYEAQRDVGLPSDQS